MKRCDGSAARPNRISSILRAGAPIANGYREDKHAADKINSSLGPAGLFFAGVLIFGELSASPDEASHALKHLSRGVPIVLLALAFHRLWRPRSPSIRVARALLVLVTLMFGAGQLEHSIGAFVGELPHFVAGLVSSEVAIIGLGIFLANARMFKTWRPRVQQRSSEL